MNRQITMLLLAAFLLLPQWVFAETVPDYYLGDSAIYVGGKVASEDTKPNILIFIDTSKQMAEVGTSGIYENNTIDANGDLVEDGDPWPDAGYDTDTIFYKSDDVYKPTNTNMTEVNPATADPDEGYPVAYEALSQNGNFIGCIDSKGEQCTNKTDDYYTGDYLNWKASVGTPSIWASTTAYVVGDLVYKDGSSSRVYKAVSVAEGGTSGEVNPFPEDDAELAESYADEDIKWQPQMPLIELLEHVFNKSVFPTLAEKANFGLMKYNSNDQGGAITIKVAANSEDDLVASMSEDIVPITQTANAQPLGGALWDAWLYWVGDPTGSSHSNSTSNDNAAFTPTPIEYWCQKNHMIVLATGATKDNLGASNPIAQMDTAAVLDEFDESYVATGQTHEDGYYAPEAAHYLYNSLDLEIDEVQPKVKTHIIQLMTPKIEQLVKAAKFGGNGTYINVSESSEITEIISEVLLGILESNTSFVAPVVPASPENRTYSGQRIYLGFFKPMNDEPWYGNLKKFGLNYDNQITAYDSSGDLVEATDSDGYFRVDDPDADDPVPIVRSFWTPSGTLDGGQVDSGGVGGLLKARTSARNIYTYLDYTILGKDSGTKNLYDGSHDFTTINTDLTPDMLGFDATDTTAKDELINFIHGYEADGTTKRTWVLGDILHSKPLIVNYANYTFSESNEEDPDQNKSMIFFGANDGMLHAVNDHDGEEAWAFIPPELLDDLEYVMDTERHSYFVDNSPLAYVHDADGDGTIESGDKVILIFGLRRGGGSSTLTTGSRGSYYALDISNPEQPKYLWRINSETDGFGEMGQTWSQPRLAKMNIGDVPTVVAVFGAGYDNNEDLRFGNTQEFPTGIDADTVTSASEDGFETGASTGGGTRHEVRGRGLYVVKVAELGEGTDAVGDPNGIFTPTLTNSGSKVWGATYAAGDTDLNYMTYSIPSDVLVYDQDHDGYADRFYVADTGGQLWRFNVGDSDETKWTAKRIFASNTGTADEGRKIFYKPTLTYKYPDSFIYFGTGDREHPLNYLDPATDGGAVLDRMYMVRDRESEDHTCLTEANLVDVTDNELQRDDTSDAERDALIDKLTNYSTEDSRTAYYGWRIDLDANEGEKVLAAPTVFADVAFFTTYTPKSATINVDSDPCTGGNLGVSRLYAVDAQTGEAVYNWVVEGGSDEFGENQTSASSQRAKGGTDDDAYVMRRADRSLAIGEGIPSGLVIVIGKDGSTSILVGSGGAFPNVELNQIETVYPLYWMTW